MAGQSDVPQFGQVGCAPSGFGCAFACSMPDLLTLDVGLRGLPAVPHTILCFSTAFWYDVLCVAPLGPCACRLATSNQHVGVQAGRGDIAWQA